MTDIQDIVANPILKSPPNQTRTVFSWTIIIKDCLWIVGLAILLGGVLNYTLLLDAINGKLQAGIQQRQLTDLRQKAEKLYPGSSFIDLVSAKKLYDDKLALFLDARTATEYQEGHIYNAVNVSIRALVSGDMVPDRMLTDKGALLITYCDGGECDIGLELAKELSERGYNNIFVLGEGYPGWEAAGYPVERAGR